MNQTLPSMLRPGACVAEPTGRVRAVGWVMWVEVAWPSGQGMSAAIGLRRRA